MNNYPVNNDFNSAVHNGFDPIEMQRAIEASAMQQAIDASLRDAKASKNRKPKVSAADEQLAAAQRRIRENYDNGRIANFDSRQPNRVFHQQAYGSQVSSCNFKSIFKRGVQLSLGLAAFGLAAYVAHNHMGDIQTALANFQGMGAQLVAKISELTTQYEPILRNYLTLALTTTTPSALNTTGKIGLAIFLLLIKTHKAVANTVIFLAKGILNHTQVALTIALLAISVIYVPEINQKAAPYLADALQYLAVNGKYIGVILFDLMVLGFIHKAFDKCCGNNFNGNGHRL